MVLVPVSIADLQAMPSGSSAWVASTPEMQGTVKAARACGLAVTELFPRGEHPVQWFLNHLDSLDQHHNESSQRPPYSELLVFGLEPTPEVDAWLRGFGFGAATLEPFGFSASKNGPSAMAKAKAKAERET